MDDEVEVQWHADHNWLQLRCESEAYSRLVQTVVDQVQLPQEVARSEIHVIEISDRNCTVDTSTPQGWRDRVALLGCALVGFLLCFAMLAGIATIAGWIRP